MRRHENHGIMGGAAAKRGSAGIIGAPLAGKRIGHALFFIRLLAPIVRIVADEELPAHRRMFGRERVEDRHLIIFRHIFAGFFRATARFEQHYAKACLGEPCRKSAAAGARANDGKVAFDHAPKAFRCSRTAQNVLMNSISARLSLSLNAGSLPKDFSSSLRPSVSLNWAVPK